MPVLNFPCPGCPSEWQSESGFHPLSCCPFAWPSYPTVVYWLLRPPSWEDPGQGFFHVLLSRVKILLGHGNIPFQGKIYRTDGLVEQVWVFDSIEDLFSSFKIPPSRYSCISLNGPIKKWVKMQSTAMMYSANEGQKPEVMLTSTAKASETSPSCNLYLMKML